MELSCARCCILTYDPWMVRRHWIVLAFCVAVGGLLTNFADAQRAEALDPWTTGQENGPRTGANATPPEVDLRPLQSTLPAWSLQRVLDPWANEDAIDRQFRPDELRLTRAARHRAGEIARCLGSSPNWSHWFELTSSPQGRPSPVDACLRNVALARDIPNTYTLVLNVRGGKLRDVYVVRTSRIQS